MVTVPMLLNLIGVCVRVRATTLSVFDRGCTSTDVRMKHQPHTQTHTAWLVDPDSRRLTRLLGRQFFCLATGGVGPLLRYGRWWWDVYVVIMGCPIIFVELFFSS